MINAGDAIRNELRIMHRFESMLTERKNKLGEYEGWYLSVTDGKYYYRCRTVNCRLERKYIGKADKEDVKKYQELRLVTDALSKCRENIKWMNRTLDHYHRVLPDDIAEHQGDAYKDSTTLSFLVTPQEMLTAEAAWLEKAKAVKQAEKPFRPDELMHHACDGTLVRTRIELDYYNELIRRGYAVIYELPTVINGILYHPDITVFSRKLGRPVIIEHFGYMGVNRDYATQAGKKIYDYLQAGYEIGVDLLIFFETADGRINSESIFREFDRVFET